MTEKSVTEMTGDEMQGYQIGAHDVKRDTSLSGGELIEFDYESAAVFKRLADDIYESAEAGIREPLQNALTAIRRAIAESNLSEGEGVVEMEIHDGDRVQLVLQDNGIGISRDVLQEVLAVIGRSQNRDDGTVSGKYGMGFLACYKLVGTDGGFMMYTNSRQTAGEPIKGIWKPGGFEMDTDGELPEMLSETDYGTRFEFTLKEDISLSDVREWIERHAKWARTPIIYREFDANGELVDDDEYGIQRLLDAHKDAPFCVSIDREHFTAVCSDRAESQTLLLNSPIKRNSQYDSWRNSEAPKGIDIRLENENGVVVKGPHKGLMPVSEAEYSDMSEGRREDYIPETDLIRPQNTDNVMRDSVDVTLPKPTGTRDTLERDEYFWSYLHKLARQSAKEKLTSYLSSVDAPEDFFALSDSKQAFIQRAITILGFSESNQDKFQIEINSELDVPLSDEMANFYVNMSQPVFQISRGASEREATRKESSESTSRRVGDVIRDAGNSGDVYMGVSMHQPKMNAVWDAHEDNELVRVEEADVYADYEELYGWRQLKNVRDYIDEDTLSKHVKQGLDSSTSKSESTSVADTPLTEREMTVHTESGGRNGFTVEELFESYNDEECDEKLVLFPSNCDYNLSDYYDIVSPNVSIANSLVKVWDYLKDAENVTRIEDWEETVQEMSFTTSDGKMTGQDIRNYDSELLFHVVNSEVVDAFRQQDVMNNMKHIPQSDLISDEHALNQFNPLTTLYVPLTPAEIDYLSVLFFNRENRDNIHTIHTNGVNTIGEVTSVAKSNTYIYAWARVPDWHGSERLKAMNSSAFEFEEEWRTLVDNVAESDKAIETTEFEHPADTQTFQTSEGELTANEMESQFGVVLVHVVSVDTAHLFRQEDIISEAKEYVYNNFHHTRRATSDRLDNFELSEIVYVPLTDSRQSHLKKLVDSDSIYSVSGNKYNRYSDGNIDNETAAYAFARLSKEQFENLIPPESRVSSLNNLSNGGLELVESIASLYDT